MEKRVVRAFKKDPTLSTRKAAKRANFPSRTTVQNILKDHAFRPYKMLHLHKFECNP